MENFIVIAIILITVSLAGLYIYKSKKSGKKCIGCPYAESCGEKCNCTSKQNQ